MRVCVCSCSHFSFLPEWQVLADPHLLYKLQASAFLPSGSSDSHPNRFLHSHPHFKEYCQANQEIRLWRAHEELTTCGSVNVLALVGPVHCGNYLA